MQVALKTMSPVVFGGLIPGALISATCETVGATAAWPAFTGPVGSLALGDSFHVESNQLQRWFQICSFFCKNFSLDFGAETN